MLDDAFKFVIEWVAEGAVKESIGHSSLRIKGHPYLTCIYRGCILAVVAFLGLLIWRCTSDVAIVRTVEEDLKFSALLGGIFTFILLFVTASWRLFSPKESFRQ